MRLIAILVVVVVSQLVYFMVSGVTRNSAAKAKEKAEYRGLANDLEALMAESKDMDIGKVSELSEAREVQVGATLAEKTREALNAYMRNQLAVRAAYLQELDKAGISKLLDATRIAKDEDLKESQAMMKVIRAVTEDYRVKTLAALESGPQWIRDQKFEPAKEASMIQAIERGVETSRPMTKEIWDLEMKSLGVMEEQIAFLGAKKGSWKVTEGSFIFDQDEDADRYNQYLEDLDKMVKRQEEIQNAAADRSKSKIEKLKTEARN